MVKYCIEKYPLGSFPHQQTPGKFMDDYLYDNISILAKNIVNDMTFLGVLFSSTLEVGTGKSTLAQQIGEAYTDQVNKMHGKNLTFTEKNIVFKPKDLVERSFQLEPYSCIVLDEWEDAHYWSELGVSLRSFFRKCRQLNLFMIIIIPDFFQLPIGYALSRSAFAIDVRFENEFERGYFRFYNYERKKDLYILGKKTHNYNVVLSNFYGRFTHGYAIPEDVYRAIKKRDLIDGDENDVSITQYRKVRNKIVAQLHKNLPITNHDSLAHALGVHERTLYKMIENDTKYSEGGVEE